MKSNLLIIGLLISLTTYSQLVPIVDSIPMRDGKKLAADIYLPQGTGHSYPVILIQTPYNRQYYRYNLPLKVGLNLSSQPYAFVIADWRCFYGSQSACVTQPDRGKDGYDAVEWIAQQSWSDGNIGTWGPSALGRVQFWTARENPPHLKCIVPLVASPQYDYHEYYPGGVFRTEYVQQLDNLGFGLSTFLLSHPHFDATWQYLENYHFYPTQIQVPAFMIGGWYDHGPDEMVEFYAAIKNQSPVTVREKHKILMGPWAHGGFGIAQVGTGQQGQLFYPAAAGWSDSLAIRFFDYYLRNVQNSWDQQPNVLYFQMGEDVWKNSTVWPTGETTDYRLYFCADESLTITPQSSGSDYLEIVYDPGNPSPTVGGPTLRQDLQQGPYDQAPVVESRNDILTFTTAPLLHDVVMKGKASVKIFASSDRLDTDFAIRITDVYPDGRSMILVDGIRRARFRDGFTVNDTNFILQGNVFPVTVDLPPTANTFLAGHSIRVDVSSSNYPRFDKNLNNGGNMYVAGDTLIATNRIYCNSPYASYVELPLIFYSSTKGNLYKNSSFSIYPNPVTDNLYFNNANEINTYQIFSTDGIMVKEGSRILSGSISVENLSQGLYFIIIADKKNEKTIIKFNKL